MTTTTTNSNTKIRNTYVYGVNKNYAANQIAVQRANSILPELHGIPEKIIFNGFELCARAEFALMLSEMVKTEDLCVSDKQLAMLQKSGTLRLGIAMPGFTGVPMAREAAGEVAQLTSEAVLQQAIKQAIDAQTADFRRFLELSCQDAIDNPTELLAKIINGDHLTMGKIKTVGVNSEDMPTFLGGLDLPLERIKSLALSERYADMLRNMVSDLASYKPTNARVLSDSLAVDIVLTNDAQHVALKNDGYIITAKSNSVEAAELQQAMQQAMGNSDWGKVASIGMQLDKLKSLFVVSKSI